MGIDRLMKLHRCSCRFYHRTGEIYGMDFKQRETANRFEGFSKLVNDVFKTVATFIDFHVIEAQLWHHHGIMVEKWTNEILME
jgi:hypothetical protein